MKFDPIAALLGEFTQQSRLLRLTTPAGPDKLLAECVKGMEGMGEGFRFEITALSLDAHIELKSLAGQPALLELLPAASRTDLRPIHGQITSIELIGANGGFARYRLVVEPWTAFLGRVRDSAVYQDMDVFDILESVFADYQGQGRLGPAWRMDVRDRTLYPRRSLTTQYRETDLAFVNRLMVEEGLFHWFEHVGDIASAALGSHTLVIGDHNAAFVPNVQPVIRFTQPGAVMPEDSFDRWHGTRRWQTNKVELQSWDYRTVNSRPVTAAGSIDNAADHAPLVVRDISGQYGWETQAQGQRLADNRMQALETANKTFTGAGTVRTLAPGTTFTLQGHATYDLETSEDARTFAVLRVHHLMHNNLSADLQADIADCLGRVALSSEAEDEASGASNAAAGERPLYRNRVDALRVAIPYRPLDRDARGRLLHPKPVITGQQSAIVVGPPGSVIHTDRDHRVKVQFHWQRGDNSHSRLAHPHPARHAGAPADDSAGTWVRVATALAPTAGSNWGAHGIPRIGQEVLIDFLEGDIDRPVVIGSLYNGRGQPDAQHNEAVHGRGTATSNAPAWFAGQAAGHAHPAALSGIKTQTLDASQRGSGAYRQFVFDDSSRQPRIGLQHHAHAHQGTAELNLGHLHHQTDNQRLQPVGFGAELKTEHSAALRAGQGLLLTGDRRVNAHGTQLDAREAVAQIQQSHALHTAFADLAQQHRVRLPGEPAAQQLPAIAQLAHVIDVLNATAEGIGSPGKGGQGRVPAWSEAHLQLSAPAGIAAATPADAIFVAGHSTSIAAGHDINTAAQGNSSRLAAEGISLFTCGKAQDGGKPNQETGIKLHAASGKLGTQSRADKTQLTAEGDIAVTGKGVKVAAPRHALLTAVGAALKIEGGSITLTAPGKIELKAAVKELAGPGKAAFTPLKFTPAELKGCAMKLSEAADAGSASVRR